MNAPVPTSLFPPAAHRTPTHVYGRNQVRTGYSIRMPEQSADSSGGQRWTGGGGPEEAALPLAARLG